MSVVEGLERMANGGRQRPPERFMEPSPSDHSDWASFILAVLINIWQILSFWTTFFYDKLFGSKEQELITQLKSATTFEDWSHIAEKFDNLPQWAEWRTNPVDSLYDYKHVEQQYQTLRKWEEERNMYRLSETIRPALPRRMYGLTNFGLYTKTYASTKTLIHKYIDETVSAIRTFADTPIERSARSGQFSNQEKQNTLHGFRMTYGSTALILQGGSIFGLCHLGVVKALSERGVLPRVIVGTATGALMAALVGIHTEEELPAFLHGGSINLSAFAASSRRAREKADQDQQGRRRPSFIHDMFLWFLTVKRRVVRYWQHGFVLDPDTLAQCVQDNVGNTTFEEAFKRTGRALNIIISSPSEELPALHNHLTTPNTLIRSAAMASHVTNMRQNKLASLQLLKKDSQGNIIRVNYDIPDAKSQTRRSRSAIAQQNPVRRLRQQMNVEHFIISQARPYILPFAQPSLPFGRGSKQGRRWLTRIIGWIVKHTLFIARSLHILPASIRRIIRDEAIPAGFDSFTLVPDVGLKDWLRLLKNPVKEDIDIWILKGERSVWPSLCALKVRMDIEMELQRVWDKITKRTTTPQREPSSDGHMTTTPPTQREEEDRVLRELKNGTGGSFIPGFTDMDDELSIPDGAGDEMFVAKGDRDAAFREMYRRMGLD